MPTPLPSTPTHTTLYNFGPTYPQSRPQPRLQQPSCSRPPRQAPAQYGEYSTVNGLHLAGSNPAANAAYNASRNAHVTPTVRIRAHQIHNKLSQEQRDVLWKVLEPFSGTSGDPPFNYHRQRGWFIDWEDMDAGAVVAAIEYFGSIRTQIDFGGDHFLDTMFSVVFAGVLR